MVPRQLDDSDWQDIETRLNDGDSWVRIADQYGMRESSLRSAAKKRGLLRSKSNGRSDAVLPRTAFPEEAELRQALTYIAKQTGEKDPEKLIVACRDWMAEIADALKASILQEEDPKYQGMPNLGTRGTRWGGDSALNRIAVRAGKEGMGLRELLGLIKDLAKLETERMQYHRPKLASNKLESKQDPNQFSEFIEAIRANPANRLGAVVAERVNDGDSS